MEQGKFITFKKVARFISHIRRIWERMFLFQAYYRKAGTIYDLHSPYLFRFIEFVMDPGRLYYDMAKLRPLRDMALRKHPYNPIETIDHTFRSANACCRRWTAQCLYRVVLFQKARRILVLGTGNGLDTIFLNRAAGTASEIFVIEPVPEYRTQSREIFSSYAPGIHLYSSFNELKAAHADTETLAWDLVFWGRSYNPDTGSSNLFRQIEDMTSNTGIWVVAEPHENRDRYYFWQNLLDRQRSLASFRCWSFGVVFFSLHFHEKYHFTFIPWKLKPWDIGLWGKGLPLAGKIRASNESKDPISG